MQEGEDITREEDDEEEDEEDDEDEEDYDEEDEFEDDRQRKKRRRHTGFILEEAGLLSSKVRKILNKRKKTIHKLFSLAGKYLE